MIVVAIYWTISAMVGMLVFSALTVLDYRSWRHLQIESVKPGEITMALLHLRIVAMLFWIALVFFVLGLVTILPHPPDSWQIWVARAVLMTINPLIIIIGLLDLRARAAIGQSKKLQ